MSRSDEILLNTFLEAAGGEWRGVAVDDLLALLAAALEERALAASPAATSTATRAASGGGQEEDKGIVSKVLGSVFGMAPVAKVLFSIFGGGDDEGPPPPLVRFALPPSLRFEAANSPGGVTGLDYGQEGLPRAAVRRLAKSGQAEEAIAGGQMEIYGGGALEDAELAARRTRSEMAYMEPVGSAERQTAREPAQVTIQVQAMDSRSFLDHSAEIAQAVREAMLNMHALNDVVNDI